MSLLFDGYWPWWLGASALATIAIGIYLLERRMLGVSGSVAACVTPEDPSAARARKDPQAVQRAMLEATLKEFGDDMSEDEIAELRAQLSAPATPRLAPSVSLPRSVHASFLLMMIAGGALGAIATGDVSATATLHPVHEAMFGSGALMYAVLAAGGVCVGLGTRMAGGCTSGHGLVGCGRMQIASLVATGVFFGTAVAVSLALPGGL